MSWIAIFALAAIIAGEAPGCSLEAKIAVGQVHANRIEAGIDGGWFGYDDPTLADVQAAMVASAYPDTVAGALYMIGPGDRERMPWLTERTGRWDCPGTFLDSWR